VEASPIQEQAVATDANPESLRSVTVPTEIHTPRFVLRPWRAGDAVQLQPVLVENWEHLSPWIPRRVADPATVVEVEQRLESFASDFANDLKWRYGMFSPDERAILGEIDLFPRDATDRVTYSAADRAEIGYWIRKDMAGQGLVTEGVEAIIGLARGLDRIARLEIRCDAANLASSAIPKRLGFLLERTVDEPASAAGHKGSELQIWIMDPLTR
jgi:RimJ/RimL family protein N-acetyltransferase